MKKGTIYHLCSLLTALLAAVALHVPFALVHSTETICTPKTSFSSAPHAIVLTTPNRPGSKHDIQNTIKAIQFWSDLFDPSLLVLRDPLNGFAALYHKAVPPFHAQKIEHLPFPRTNLLPPPSLSLSFDDASLLATPLQQRLLNEWNVRTAPSLPALSPIVPVQGLPIWRTPDGRRLVNSPEISDSILSDASGQDFLPLKDESSIYTELEIIPLKSLPIPRILIRKSCGNAALDTAAAQALRKLFVQHKVAPEDLAVLKASELKLLVDWRL